jgi:hypothetical protein
MWAPLPFATTSDRHGPGSLLQAATTGGGAPWENVRRGFSPTAHVASNGLVGPKISGVADLGSSDHDAITAKSRRVRRLRVLFVVLKWANISLAMTAFILLTLGSFGSHPLPHCGVGQNCSVTTGADIWTKITAIGAVALVPATLITGIAQGRAQREQLREQTRLLSETNRLLGNPPKPEGQLSCTEQKRARHARPKGTAKPWRRGK